MIASKALVYVSILFALTNFAYAGEIAEYYKKMVGQGKSKYPALSANQKVGGADVYLVTDDIFAFVGCKGKKPDYPVDAFIMSTNIQLDYTSHSPRVQKRFLENLSQKMRDKVMAKFDAMKKQKKTLAPVTEPLVINLGKSAPRYVCFLATDLSSGNTYNNDKWQKFLAFENLGEGINKCIKSMPHAKTIVIPLIGSSINPSVENVVFVNNETLREEHINRRVRSLKGIMKGIKASAPKSCEIGIVIWDKDIDLIVEPRLRQKEKYLTYCKPGSFWDLRNQFMEVMFDKQ